jgi:DNA-binding SARP family transcriptional activator
LGAAERSARALTEAAPYRESGHRFLMATLAARGNVAEALIAYEALRRLLREDLGAAPAPATQTLHRRLLQGSAAGLSGN